MFIDGAYQPLTFISSAIDAMHSPYSCAISVFHVNASMTTAGSPIELTPVKLL